MKTPALIAALTLVACGEPPPTDSTPDDTTPVDTQPASSTQTPPTQPAPANQAPSQPPAPTGPQVHVLTDDNGFQFPVNFGTGTDTTRELSLEQIVDIPDNAIAVQVSLEACIVPSRPNARVDIYFSNKREDNLAPLLSPAVTCVNAAQVSPSTVKTKWFDMTAPFTLYVYALDPELDRGGASIMVRVLAWKAVP